jgi:hypothetical protein
MFDSHHLFGDGGFFVMWFGGDIDGAMKLFAGRNIKRVRQWPRDWGLHDGDWD